jgi:hypothetical protein
MTSSLNRLGQSFCVIDDMGVWYSSGELFGQHEDECVLRIEDEVLAGELTANVIKQQLYFKNRIDILGVSLSMMAKEIPFSVLNPIQKSSNYSFSGLDSSRNLCYNNKNNQQCIITQLSIITNKEVMPCKRFIPARKTRKAKKSRCGSI